MSVCRIDNSTAQHSTAQHSTAQHSTADNRLNFHKKKILLVTSYGDGNYGNYGTILQRYALSRVIESLGFEVHHLYSFSKPKKPDYFGEFVIRPVKTLIKRMLALIGIRKYLDKEIRYKNFQDFFNKKFSKKIETFTEQYINNKIFMSHDEVLSADKSRWEEYNFVVTGSDVIWWRPTLKGAEYYYLEFIPREKRVCYAPSFGVLQFPEEEYEIHKKGLEGFNKLSCREQGGVNLIKQTINKDAQLVLDPTLLLNASQWRELEKKPDIDLPEHYALKFFYGEIPPEYDKAIKQAAGDLPIVNLCTCPDLPGCIAEVSEFLYLFNHADLIFTSSFHGTAFSINFGKNFYSFVHKGDHSGRINSILNSLNLTNHLYTPESKARPDEINYNEVNEKLNILRESSLKYLRDCLHV